MATSLVAVIALMVGQSLALTVTWPGISCVWYMVQTLNVTWIYGSTDPPYIDLQLWGYGVPDGVRRVTNLGSHVSTMDAFFLVDNGTELNIPDGPAYWITVVDSANVKHKVGGESAGFPIRNQSTFVYNSETVPPLNAATSFSAGFTSFLSQTNSFGIVVTLSTTSSQAKPSSDRTDSSSTKSGSSSGSTGANPTPSHPENSGGLSTGAKAGIGCGVAIVVIGALFILFVFFRRQKKPQRSTTSTNDASKYDGKPELEGSSSVPTDGPYYEEKPELESTVHHFSVGSPADAVPAAELPSLYRGIDSEVSASVAVTELGSNPIVHELPTTPSSNDGQVTERPQQAPASQGSQLSPWTNPMAGILPDSGRTEVEDLEQLERQERDLADSIDATRTLQQLEAEHAAFQERIRLARARVLGIPTS